MKRILIIDDDRVSLLIGRRFLSQQYAVDIVYSGTEALDYLSTVTPDLIMLDVYMPEMSGFEVLEKIHALPACRDIPVIFVTADRSEQTEEDCFNLGATEFINKPFLPAVMLSRVKHVLDLADHEKALKKVVAEQNEKISQLQDCVVDIAKNLLISRDRACFPRIEASSRTICFLVDRLMDEGVYPETITPSFALAMRRAAPLYDIGKMTLPDYILQKGSNLSDDEMNLMTEHAKAGATIIQQSISVHDSDEFMHISCDMASYHHELWDGSGYPYGLKGEEIPICARIACVADAFGTLISPGYNAPVRTMAEAFEIMDSNSRRYDPVIYDVFTRYRGELARLLTDCDRNNTEN